MKKLMLLFLLVPVFCFAQDDPANYNGLKIKKVTSPEGIENFQISDSIKVEQGNDEKINVFFLLVVPVDEWNEYKGVRSDSAAFLDVTTIVSWKAKAQLQNKLSFIPMRKQLIFFLKRKKEKEFMANYKCYGRNGYGNSVETEIFTQYKITKK